MGSLSKTQSSIVTGCMLGDGYMRCKTNAHLQVTHSIKQKDYVDWMYSVLKNFVLTPPKSYKGNGNRIGYRFFTRSLPCFTDIYHQFYDNKKKISNLFQLKNIATNETINNNHKGRFSSTLKVI